MGLSSSDNLLDSKDLFQDIIECPDRDDNLQINPFWNYFESKYYNIKQTGTILDKAEKQHGFSIFNCNMRSLPKNLSLLQDILLSMKEGPDVIAISETKLKENNLTNINIPGYEFLNTNSKRSAGGVGLYLINKLNFIRRRDLQISMEGVESCWIEIIRKRQKIS